MIFIQSYCISLAATDAWHDECERCFRAGARRWHYPMDPAARVGHSPGLTRLWLRPMQRQMTSASRAFSLPWADLMRFPLGLDDAYLQRKPTSRTDSAPASAWRASRTPARSPKHLTISVAQITGPGRNISYLHTRSRADRVLLEVLAVGWSLRLVFGTGCPKTSAGLFFFFSGRISRQPGFLCTAEAGRRRGLPRNRPSNSFALHMFGRPVWVSALQPPQWRRDQNVCVVDVALSTRICASVMEGGIPTYDAIGLWHPS